MRFLSSQKLWIRPIALMVLVCFTVSTCLSSAPAFGASVEHSGVGSANSAPSGDAHAQNISIPAELGTIEQTFTADAQKWNAGPHVIYIQDAHASLEAQENIARLISPIFSRL